MTVNSFISGWYAILPSMKLAKMSRPLSIERFGVPLVLWRQNNGQIVILLDKCPHRGAKLSLGKVVDNTIRCPFHGYQFGEKGNCAFAPEFNKAIPGLTVSIYPVRETMGMIWMYWGSAEASSFDVTELKALHHHFSGHFSSIQATWQSHITYCIENQLDYTHLRFVHHNTIGRGFKMPNDPKEVLDEKSIAIYLHDHTVPALKYYFPNVWTLNISSNMKLMLFFVPIDHQRTQLYLRAYRRFLNYPVIKHVMDWVMNLSNHIILKQDQRVVVSQGDLPSYLAKDDVLMRYDKSIRYFRQRWRKLIP